MSAAVRARVAVVAHIFGAAVIVGACASQGAPPGGPPDVSPPKLLSRSPDTNATNVKQSKATFRFDEVISERPAGAPTLNDLFIISPNDGQAKVSWHRSRLDVSSRKRWRPNTTYVITMLPGLADLRGNSTKSGQTLVFSTGPTLAAGAISGRAFDWATGKTLVLPVVEAIRLPDSTKFIALGDSVGAFTVGHLPAGRFLVRAYADGNHNRGLDPGEAFDTATIAITDTASLEMLAFVHDTAGAGIANVEIRDSVTLSVTFTLPLDASQTVSPSQFSLKASDSSSVEIVSATAMTEAATKAANARRDSIARAADTTRKAPSILGDTSARHAAGAPEATPLPTGAAPVPSDTTRRFRPSKPLPFTEIVLVLGTPLKPGVEYRLRVTGLRNLVGATHTSERVVRAPQPAAKFLPPGNDSTPKKP